MTSLPRLCMLTLAALAPLPLFASAALAADAAPRAVPDHVQLLSARDEATLRQMLKDWFVAFSAKHYAAIDQYFAAPYTAIGNQTAILPDMIAVRRMWQRTRDHLDGTQYSHTEAVGLRVIPRSATLALLNIHWRRLNQDGSTMNEGSEFYFASKVAGRWHFNGGMSQDLPEFDAVAQMLCAGSTASAK